MSTQLTATTRRSHVTLLSIGTAILFEALVRTRKADLLASYNGPWLLRCAAAANDEEMVTILVDSGVDLDARVSKDGTARWAAVYAC